MLSELIIYIIVFFHYYFKTTLPYKWDICGLEFERSSKLLINYGSYVIVYAFFIYWFVQCALKLVRNFSQWHLRGKGRFLAYVILISAATQVFWRPFLLTTYFFTGSFYPWCTASTVIFLNFPSTLIVLTSIGNGLHLMFQGFVVKLLNFESVTRGHTSSEQPAGRTQIRLLDARIFDSTETQPIVSGYSEESIDDSEYSFVIRTPGTRIHDGERSQASSEAAVSYDYFSGIRILPPPDARIFDSAETQPILSGYSEESIDDSEYSFVIRPPGTRIHDGERSQASSEAAVSYDYFSGIRILPPPDANGFHGTEDHLPLSRSSEHRELKLLTETVTPVEEQITSRQQESIPSTSAESKGEKVSKRKVTTEGNIRSTRKERNRMGVSESTTGIHRENDQDFIHRTRSGLIYGPLKR